ncbi:Inner membrane transport permease [Flagellimonas maritima]|uniref:Inner membrane transport permease n=1 Tax=Flagellimonas maritima TaxID=1383885 RepID=A0A2Z4LR64_9FLAO|nr:ABC transporter permease [Allomuricauda aurantiaca]AWX44391.1 Inner membrane transport permease [Allomuricauda aurantiaca]
MFKVFKAFVKKEFYHILRDKRTLLILFGMPIAQVLIFGFAVTNEFNDTKIDVLDYAKDVTSNQLIDHIQSSGHFMVNNRLLSEKEMEDGFKAGASKIVVAIPENFSEDFYAGANPQIQVITDGSDPNNANTLVQYVTQMVNTFKTERSVQGGTPYQIQLSTQMMYNPQLVSSYNFVPGTIALILLIICAMLTSLTIAKENEKGTMEVLLVSPLPPVIIILGKVTPYALLSFGIAVLVVLIGNIVFGVPVLGSFGLLMLMCLLYVITALSLGTLISTKSDTQQKAMMTSLMSLMMPSLILSGFIFPMSSMPQVLQWIGHIIPAKYFIDILKGIMLRGVGMDFLLFEVGVLLLMTLVFLVLTWRNFKIRLE